MRATNDLGLGIAHRVEQVLVGFQDFSPGIELDYTLRIADRRDDRCQIGNRGLAFGQIVAQPGERTGDRADLVTAPDGGDFGRVVASGHPRHRRSDLAQRPGDSPRNEEADDSERGAGQKYRQADLVQKADRARIDEVVMQVADDQHGARGRRQRPEDDDDRRQLVGQGQLGDALHRGTFQSIRNPGWAGAGWRACAGGWIWTAAAVRSVSPGAGRAALPAALVGHWCCS